MAFSGLTAILNDVWDALTHALRVEPASGSFPVSGTVTADQGVPGATAWPVTQGSSDVTATGQFTATGQTLKVACNGKSQATYSLQGTWTGQVAVEISQDGSNWFTVALNLNQQSFAANASPLVINGLWTTTVAGWNALRLRSTGVWTGTATVNINASVGSYPLLFPPATVTIALADGLPNSVKMFSDPPGNRIVNQCYLFVKNGSTGLWDQLRTPATFKDGQASASGSTALWTPATGKKFRLMRYMALVTGDASLAVAGELTIRLLDNATGIGQRHIVNLPAAAGTGPTLYVSPWIDLGNGILSAAINQTLNINLSAALASGLVSVICCGTEE